MAEESACRQWALQDPLLTEYHDAVDKSISYMIP